MSDRSLTLAESCAVRSTVTTSLSERTANLLPRTAGTSPCILRKTAPTEAGMVDGTGGVKSASNASITLSGAVHSS